jgi:dTDP-4-dehydrorhamnose reductase
MIVILGASGLVGTQLQKQLPQAVALDRKEINVTDEIALKHKLLELRPEVIINCVAYNNVDGAEDNPVLAYRLNAELVQNLVQIANELDATLVHFSTGYVFDGKKESYQETDAPAPLSLYAKSKLEGEKFAQKAHKYFLIRTNLVFGPAGKSELSKQTFVDLMLGLAQKKQEFQMVNDEINSITYAADLAASVKKLLHGQFAYGIYHIVNAGEASWYDFAKEIFAIKNLPIKLEPVSSQQFTRPAKRPARAVLANNKFPPLRLWQEALKEYLSTT